MGDVDLGDETFGRMEACIGQNGETLVQLVGISYQKDRPSSSAAIPLQNERERKQRNPVKEVSCIELVYGAVAVCRRMGSTELPKEPDIPVLSFKTKPVGVVRKDARTQGFQLAVLIGFDVLGKDDGPGRNHGAAFFD